MASITSGKIDLKVLRVLQENDHLTNVELSERVALSPSPYLCHLKQLEDTGIIRKYVALFSLVAAGFGLQALIRVSVSRARAAREEFSAAVQMWLGVLSCSVLTGEIDYLLYAFSTDTNASPHFVLDTLPPHGGVQDAQSSFVLKEIENTTALPLTHLQRD